MTEDWRRGTGFGKWTVDERRKTGDGGPGPDLMVNGHYLTRCEDGTDYENQ